MSTQYVYTLTFSDPGKSEIITIPGTSTGPGKNNYDTSLDLVGPGYVGYGKSIAQNFLKLLENFSGPNPPQNSIEGQLWYDTSNPDRSVLRINNGELSAARWPVANGIYQQANDPYTQYLQNVKDGDIWVDTNDNQLKIRFGDVWTIVGPSTSATENRSGLDVEKIFATTGEEYPVIKLWINGNVVAIISYNEFTPRLVIDGFSLLKPGINLTNKVDTRFNGLAERAASLQVSRTEIIRANEVLKNRVSAASRQIHTGTLVVESINGLSIKRNSITPELKLYADSNTAYINFTATTGYMKIGLQDNSYFSFNSNGKVGINTTASFLSPSSPTLTVNGGASFSNAVSITVPTITNNGLTLGGSASISGNLNIGGSLSITNKTTVSNTLTVVDIIASTSTAEIGSVTVPFERIYVTTIGTTGTEVFIYGTTETAERLESSRNFRVDGVITSTNVAFNGTASVVLTATTNASLITGTVVTTSTTATQTLLVVNTATGSGQLNQISKRDFLSDVYSSTIQTGMIVPFGGQKNLSLPNRGAPEGWLWCDNVSTATVAHPDLYAVLGLRYTSSSTVVGSFQVPDLSTANFITTGTTTGTYLTYIIKT
jgi:hypothetical protein